MAKSNLQVSGIVLFCLTLLARQSDAYEFTVGWTVPSDPNVNILNQWAEKNRFQITDSVAFAYPPGNDSVLYVNQDDYKSCNTAAPIAKYVDGHTVFKFNHSGPFYFISGNTDNCRKNEKITIVVLADRSKTSATSTPPPPHSESSGTGTSPPSPSPSTEQAPSPTQAGTVEINPTPAPAKAEAPGNNAGMVLVSLVSSVGALVASSLFLAP